MCYDAVKTSEEIEFEKNNIIKLASKRFALRSIYCDIFLVFLLLIRQLTTRVYNIFFM